MPALSSNPLTSLVTSVVVAPSVAPEGTTNDEAEPKVRVTDTPLVKGLLDNAGTLEEFVVNYSGSAILDESLLISTTAISAGSTSANTFYSTTARSNVAFRITGFVDAVNTSGAWANPTEVQGAGGQALQQIGKIGNSITKSWTSGTTLDFTGVPTWAKRVYMSLSGIQTSGASNMMIQLGTSGGFVAAGYVGGADNQGGAGGTATSFTTGMGLERVTAAAYIMQGLATFIKQPGGDTWVGTWTGFSTGTLSIAWGATSIALGGTLDSARLTTVGGATTGTAGTACLYRD